MAADEWDEAGARFVRGYETLRGRVRTQVIDRHLAEHLPPAPARVVDVGGGAGTQSIPLARRGYDVTIADPSAAMLDRARAALDGEGTGCVCSATAGRPASSRTTSTSRSPSSWRPAGETRTGGSAACSTSSAGGQDEHVSVVRRAATVTGRVQGVSFRWYTEQRARELGLTGWVRNHDDGSVRLEAQGPEPAVAELVAWLQEGPAPARVVDVHVADVELRTGEAGFRTVP